MWNVTPVLQHQATLSIEEICSASIGHPQPSALMPCFGEAISSLDIVKPCMMSLNIDDASVKGLSRL